MENKVLEIINALAEFGKTETGTTRLSYSEEFIQAQNYLREFMMSCDMQVQIDDYGNLIGTYKGLDSSLPAVWSGSHLDTVPSGGNYDGVLGIAMPLACISHWYSSGYRPQCDVKVVAMAEEEGTLFNCCMGSQVMCGEMRSCRETDIKDAHGRTLENYLQSAGLSGSAFETAVQDLSQIKCFLEAHIEQGEELDIAGLSTGVVNSIVGIDRYEFELTGVANHAGTTRMASRKDVLVGAAFVAERLYEQALASQGSFVATIGKVNLFPNAVNVIPGEARIHIETRAANYDILADAKTIVYDLLEKMQDKYGVTYKLVAINRIAPVQLNAQIIQLLSSSAQSLGVEHQVLPSWAGHDAKVFAEYVPTGMVFARSVKGISHSPDEFTAAEDIDNTFKVFEATLKKLTEINL